MHRLAPLLLLAGSLPAFAGATPQDLEAATRDILAIGAEGQGNAAATPAWQILSQAQGEDLAILFTALDQAPPIPANYLRSAIEAAIDRMDPPQCAALVPLLGEVLLDRARAPLTRNLAFELLQSISPSLNTTLLPGLLDDPSEALRREAVQHLLHQAQQADSSTTAESRRVILLQALHFARDVEQVREIAQSLEKLNSPVDLPRHFGFLMDWQVIGPFDNTKREGFSQVFPPEENLDLSLSHPGKHGPVAWKSFSTSDPYGKVNLNEALAQEKEVSGYAFTGFESDTAREVEFRLGTKNAWKLWLNGTLLFERDEYHRGQRIDQYRLKASLQPGKNSILMKLCQDEQVQDWTVEWEFRLRVCDPTGTAVLAKNRPSPNPGSPATPRRRPAPDRS